MALALALPFAAAYGLYRVAVTETPRVPRAQGLGQAELERGRRIYRQFFPVWPVREAVRHVQLTAEDLDLGLNYVLGRNGQGYSHTRVSSDALRLDLSLRLTPPLEGHFLNLSLTFRPAGSGLQIDGLQLGALPIPVALARPLLDRALAASPAAEHLPLIEGMLREVKLRPGQIHLTLAWDQDSVRAAIDVASRQLAGVGPQQLAAYRQHLQGLAARRPRPDFGTVMGELFALARQRSGRGDAVAENRALLIALAETANGLRLGLPAAGKLHLGGLSLAGRGDYVQHFTLSAALAAIAGEELADRAGLYKEVRDTHGGSGFSFSDLAADRAGARFGARACASEADARQVQALIAGSQDTALYMPKIGDLPEFLPQAVFEGRYGGVGGQGYARLLEKIDQRITALPVHRRAAE
ncbi:MAG: hypothetical protein ACUVSD_07470 [Thiobacillaceae bacterium]